jgi:hypothetical protein
MEDVRESLEEVLNKDFKEDKIYGWNLTDYIDVDFNDTVEIELEDEVKEIEYNFNIIVIHHNQAYIGDRDIIAKYKIIDIRDNELEFVGEQLLKTIINLESGNFKVTNNKADIKEISER